MWSSSWVAVALHFLLDSGYDKTESTLKARAKVLGVPAAERSWHKHSRESLSMFVFLLAGGKERLIKCLSCISQGGNLIQPVLVRKSKETRAGGMAQSVRCLLPKQKEYNSLG